MLSGKRKQGFSGLQRRVRPRKEEEPEIDENASSGPEEMDVESDELSEDGEDEELDEEEDDVSEASPPSKKPSIDISSVSFGALAKAQASMPAPGRRRKRGAEPSDEESDSDSGPEENGRGKPKSAAEIAKRTSKHAPTEMSSKRQVSRRREVIAVPKMEVRDPRFDPLSGPVDEAKARKAYAFLDEYRADEMKQLRAEIRKTKDATKKEEMKRLLLSMESKMKARQRKDREQEVMADHKRKEKELVKQGKQPFYLKKSEQKKRLLMDQFANMKKRQVDRTIERKRKKVVARERKELDQLERRQRS
ncbi:rRNA biogenesis protein RRP36 [Colletotrichum orbiculare MAFF 240422]|uniref:rRNA biogenesis protein RRP36 n=1 Tax=Colletotrichum orbiculare (strain 104-T / ATCC 96160 / CBS 514.97 / LARS 414 / MAFF 240422) TaxID=1213857 RepID=N4V906_COLOR|nr:rRNA biogenesis protein RRP36 [Colletotrichum orbiculare MAFF 240422]